jgi:hypothetical protein
METSPAALYDGRFGKICQVGFLQQLRRCDRYGVRLGRLMADWSGGCDDYTTNVLPAGPLGRADRRVDEVTRR